MIRIILMISFCFLTLFSACQEADPRVQYGVASHYGDEFEGRPTSNGEIFRQNLLTAAHNTLPFNTIVKVTNLDNKKTVIVRINDRGPFVDQRIIDLSREAARQIDMIRPGTAQVKLDIIAMGDGATAHQNYQEQNTRWIEKEVKVHRFDGTEETITVRRRAPLTENPISSVLDSLVFDDISKENPYTDKGYGIQIGAYSNIENYRQHFQRLAPLQDKLFKYSYQRNGVTWYKLIIVSFPTKEAAQEYLDALPARYAQEKRDGFIVNLNNIK